MSLIADVLLHYFPHWEPPEDRKDWNQCLCPSHNEDRPSCSVSYERDAVNCKACGFKGDAIAIIRRQEGLNYSEAVKRAAELSGASYIPVSGSTARKSSRKVFGQSGTELPEHYSQTSRVPTWLRR